MALIKTRITVGPDGKVTLAEPLPAGECLIDPEPAQQSVPDTIDWSIVPTIDLGPSPGGGMFERAEIHGDDRS